MSLPQLRIAFLLRWVAAVATALLCGLVGGVAPAQGAVTYVGEKCASTSWNGPAGFASLSISTSGVGLAVDDVMFLSANSTDGWGAGDISGWTKLQSSGSHGTYFRVATAGDVSGADYAVMSSSDVLGGATTAVITAFRGAPTGLLPVMATPVTGNGSSLTLPNAVSPGAGSMRYSVVSIANSDAGFSRPTYNVTVSGMTNRTDCTAKNSYPWPVYGAAGMQGAYETVGAGMTSNRTASISTGAPYVGYTYILGLAGPCSTGTLSVTPPAAISFGSVTLDGQNKTRTVSPSLTVDDQAAGDPGWSLSLTSTTFSNGAHTLPTSASRVTAASAAAATGNCSVPTNSVSYPVTIPAAGSAPAPVKVFNAAVGTGSGPSTITPTLELAIPANARIGTYNSTWTFTVSSGP